MLQRWTERVKFQLIHMPCCGQMLCWVNPRLPNYCPECGKAVWISRHREAVIHTDDAATLTTTEPDTSKILGQKGIAKA